MALEAKTYPLARDRSARFERSLVRTSSAGLPEALLGSHFEHVARNASWGLQASSIIPRISTTTWAPGIRSLRIDSGPFCSSWSGAAQPDGSERLSRVKPRTNGSHRSTVLLTWPH